MVTRDVFGTVFDEGAIVAFSLSTGQIIPARVARISQGLDNTPPVVFLETELPLGIDPNGVVRGVVVLKVQTKKPDIIEGT